MNELDKIYLLSIKNLDLIKYYSYELCLKQDKVNDFVRFLSYKNDLDKVIYFEKQGAHISLDNYEDFSVLIGKDRQESVKYCIEKTNTDISIDNERFLREAVINGSISTINLIRKMGGNVHYDDDRLLSLAVKHNQPKVVAYLLTLGLNIHQHSEEALRYAILNGNEYLIKLLINRGGNLKLAVEILHNSGEIDAHI